MSRCQNVIAQGIYRFAGGGGFNMPVIDDHHTINYIPLIQPTSQLEPSQGGSTLLRKIEDFKLYFYPGSNFHSSIFAVVAIVPGTISQMGEINLLEDVEPLQFSMDNLYSNPKYYIGSTFIEVNEVEYQDALPVYDPKDPILGGIGYQLVGHNYFVPHNQVFPPMISYKNTIHLHGDDQLGLRFAGDFSYGDYIRFVVSYKIRY